MKKKVGIIVITVIVAAILVIRIIGVETLFPKQDPLFGIPESMMMFDNKDGIFQDNPVGADTCREFFDRHKESFEYFVKTIKSQPTEDSYWITFDNEGQLSISGKLEYDEDFTEALYEIYSDEIFQGNPFSQITIFWREESGLYIDWRLFTNKFLWGGMIYRDIPTGNYRPGKKEKLNDNWSWYCNTAV